MTSLNLWLYNAGNRAFWSHVSLHELNVMTKEVDSQLIGIRGADIFTGFTSS